MTNSANNKRNLRGLALAEYKQKLALIGLNDCLQDILVGTLLGDASMQAMKGDQQSNVKFEQSLKKKDYIDHLYEQFSDWVGTPPQIRNIKGGNARDRQSIWFRTYRHKVFAFCKNAFYRVDPPDAEGGTPKQRKIVPEFIHKLLTPRALAYWYMDDGSKCPQGYYRLNTQNFSYSDQKILVAALRRNFNLKASIWKDKKYYYIGILNRSDGKFKSIIEPYILPCFKYKL